MGYSQAGQDCQVGNRVTKIHLTETKHCIHPLNYREHRGRVTAAHIAGDGKLALTTGEITHIVGIGLNNHHRQ